MTSISSARVFTDQERLAYAHSNMRLKTRFNMEVTIEEWHRIGGLFRNGMVEGARKNHVGDVEGWVNFSKRTGCVKTFYASPPPMPGAPPPTKEERETIDALKAKLISQEAQIRHLGDIVADMQSEQHAKKKARADALVATSFAKQDLKWFKSMHDLLIIRQRRHLSARELWLAAKVLNAIPNNMHPGKDPDLALEFIHEQITDFWTHVDSVEGFQDGDGI